MGSGERTRSGASVEKLEALPPELRAFILEDERSTLICDRSGEILAHNDRVLHRFAGAEAITGTSLGTWLVGVDTPDQIPPQGALVGFCSQLGSVPQPVQVLRRPLSQNLFALWLMEPEWLGDGGLVDLSEGVAPESGWQLDNIGFGFAVAKGKTGKLRLLWATFPNNSGNLEPTPGQKPPQDWRPWVALADHTAYEKHLKQAWAGGCEPISFQLANTSAPMPQTRWLRQWSKPQAQRTPDGRQQLICWVKALRPAAPTQLATYGYFENSPDLVMVLRVDGRVLEANQLCRSWLGTEVLFEGTGMRFGWLHGEDRIRFAERLGELEEGGTTRFDGRAKRADGSKRWLTWRLSKPPTGGCIYAVGRDITAQRQAAEESAKYTRMLEATHRLQTEYISSAGPSRYFETILREAIALTESDVGVIYQLELSPDLMAPSAWVGLDEATNDTVSFFGKAAEDAKNLYEPVASVPKGPGWARGLLTIPLRHDGNLLAALILVRRSSGYSESLFDYLLPFLSTSVGIVHTRLESEKRARAETQLRLSEAHTRALLQAIPDHIATVDRYGRVPTAPYEQMGHHARTRWTKLPELGDAILKDAVPTIKHVLDERTTATFESQALSEDTRHFFESRVVPLNQDMALLITRDVTRNKATERELHAGRAFIENVLDLIGSLVVVVDTQGQIVRFNRACEQVSGYSGSYARGQNFWRLLHTPLEAQRVRGEFWGVKPGSAPVDVESVWRTKTGSERRIGWRTTGVFSDTGELTHVLASGIDMTERRQLESQLRQAQKLEAVGQLAAGVAHDFNNLLTAITASSDIARDRLPRLDPIRNNLDEIDAAARRAASLTRRLLTFGSRDTAHPQELALNDIVGEIRQMLTRVVGEAISIELELAPQLASIFADQGQVEQILVNLAVNARDAMPRGGRLCIRTRTLAAAELPKALMPDGLKGPAVVLEVEDSGIGMDESTLSRMFEPFFTTKGPDRGTGLGLSTVYGIVRQSKGQVLLESEPGQGTLVRIALPAHFERPAYTALGSDSSQPPPGLARPAGIGNETPKGRNERVLVVEDDAAVRTVVVHSLRRLGYQVVEASNVAETERALSVVGQPIDLLLSDVVMPELSGPELAARIRLALPELPVLFMSGYAEDVIAAHGALVGDAHILSKPFNLTSLGAAVRRALN